MDNLFDDIIGDIKDTVKEPWEDEWKGMPEFTVNDLGAYHSIIVNFENTERMIEFGKLINQKITIYTRSTWFPKPPNDIVKHLRYADES